MSIDHELRAALHDTADAAGFQPLSGVDVRRRARAVTARRRSTALTAALAACALVLSVPVTLRSGGVGQTVAYASGTPAGGGYLRWAARGDLAGVPGYETAARLAWDRAEVVRRHAPHTQVRLLLAQSTDRGAVVVVTGLDRSGDRRVAVLRGVPYARTVTSAMTLEYDRKAPPPERTVAMVFAEYPGWFPAERPLVVIGEPTLDRAVVYDSRYQRDHGLALPGGAGVALTTEYEYFRRARGYDGGKERFDLPLNPFRPPGRYFDTPVRDAYATAPREAWRSWYRAGAREPRAVAGWRSALRDTPYARTGLVTGPHSSQPLWHGRLPDGTEVFADVTGDHRGSRLLVGAHVAEGRADYVDVYVDRPVEEPLDALPGLAVVVGGAEHRWLLVVTNPRVSAVTLDGEPLPLLRRGFAYRRLGAGERAPATVTYRMGGRAHERPLDATAPLPPPGR